MARNLETKVRCDIDALLDIRTRAEDHGCGSFVRLHQVDTYFVAPRGRLKLREIVAEEQISAELIAYRRPDEAEARWSVYHRAEIARDQIEPLKEGLAAVCGVASVVRKQRDVGIMEHTRIHLDLVDGLGAFVELETVIGEQSDGSAESEHARVVAVLGLSRYDAVAGSYGDLAAPAGTGVLRNDDKGSQA